jgi:hypothetical protein
MLEADAILRHVASWGDRIPHGRQKIALRFICQAALIEAAAACLYAAKRSGRNCVACEKDEKLLTAVAS